MADNYGNTLGYSPDPEKTRTTLKPEATYEDRLMAAWTRIMFWLIIPTALSGIMTYEGILQLFPILNIPGMILGAASNLAYGYVMMRLKPVDKQYYTAGICTLIAGGINLIIAGNNAISPHWLLMITVTTNFVTFIGQYNEMSAHDTALIEKHYELSEKWANLKKWYMITFLVYVGSLMLMLLVPTLGAAIALISSLGMIAVSVFKLIYLYRTFKVFEEITA